jgi:hypothetical protein
MCDDDTDKWPDLYSRGCMQETDIHRSVTGSAVSVAFMKTDFSVPIIVPTMVHIV